MIYQLLPLKVGSDILADLTIASDFKTLEEFNKNKEDYNHHAKVLALLQGRPKHANNKAVLYNEQGEALYVHEFKL